MKRILLLFVWLCFTQALFSQTLFTYGGTVVDKEEFLRAYNKNKTPVADKEKSLREYLDLYTKFKLKVRAAQDMRLDTLQQLQYDLQNFRSQVDESYMNNEKEVNQLIDEAFLRSQKDIHVLHFFIGFGANMNPADTLDAWKAMKELQGKLKDRTEDYEGLVKEVASKYVPIKQTDLGFITVFSVPYDYENIIYGLKTGEACTPYRTKNGLHMFKVIEERKSAGKWRIAQILLAFPPGDQSLYIKALQQKADSIYNAIQHGEDFANMAKLFSDDKLSYIGGGEMPEFGTGKFDPAFEKEVFKLTKDGEVGRAFVSPYGLHIVKRLKQTPTPSDKNDANNNYDLKQKVLQDLRITSAKEKFIKEIMAKIGFKRNPAVKDAELFRYADSIIDLNADLPQKKFPINDKVIFSFAKSNVKGVEWLDFVRGYKSNSELYKGENNTALLAKFITTSAQEYYKKHLEEYNAEFRYQMEEFKEGNMLFEIMEKRVWGNAAGDNDGLLKQYEQNKKNYLWAPSASVILFNCSNMKTAEESIAALKSGKAWKKITEEGNNNIQADSGRYELSQLPLPVDTKAVAGLISTPVVNSLDGTASFIKIVTLYEGGLQRSFEEARGLVINDYQNILEEKWVDDLKKKYPVKVNEAVFASLLK